MSNVGYSIVRQYTSNLHMKLGAVEKKLECVVNTKFQFNVIKDTIHLGTFMSLICSFFICLKVYNHETNDNQ